MENKYQICCISHGRHENLARLIKLFGTDNIIFFVKDQEDLEKYTYQNNCRAIISGGVIESRNAALQYCQKMGVICVQMSDDLKKIAVNDFTGKRTGLEVTAKEAIEDIIIEFEKSEYKLCGFPPTDNPFFALKPYELNKFIVGDFIIIKPNDIRFDTNINLKEDYDYTLQHIKKYGGCIRYAKYLNSFEHYVNKGGAVSHRTAIQEQNIIRYLMQKWGSCIRLNPKRQNEILFVNTITKEMLNINQSTLF